MHQWVRSLDPDQIPHQDIDSKLVLERGLAHILVGTEEVPLLRDPLL